MRLSIRAVTNPDTAVPLLRELRNMLDAPVFRKRLTAALGGGYALLAAYDDAGDGDRMVGVLGYRVVDDICWGRSQWMQDLSLVQENDRLRRENRILKEERDILKKAAAFLASQRP